MDKELQVILAQTYQRKPLAVVRNFPGLDAELTPAELRGLAGALTAVAEDCERRSGSRLIEVSYSTDIQMKSDLFRRLTDLKRRIRKEGPYISRGGVDLPNPRLEELVRLIKTLRVELPEMLITPSASPADRDAGLSQPKKGLKTNTALKESQ